MSAIEKITGVPQEEISQVEERALRNKADVVIERPIEQVWTLFTDVTSWTKWWGGDLKAVTPAWKEGAQALWSSGAGATVTDYAERKRVGLRGSYGEKVVWLFSEAPGGRTCVGMGEDLSGSELGSFSSARVAEFAEKLRKLKALVEADEGVTTD